MAINSTYYLDAVDLISATAVYLDAGLINLAPDGFYRDGAVVRQQSTGILLIAQDCPSCSGTSCAIDVDLNSYQGIYLIDLDEGTDIGAIVIRINTNTKPEGIRATYNGIVYNKLSSPVDGLHQSSNYGHFTVIGQASQDCGLVGNNNTYPELDEYLYDGSVFNLTGNIDSVTINSTDVSLSSVNPNTLYMVIPKPTAAPSIVNVQIVGLCAGTDFSIQTFCPVVLPSFSSSIKNLNASIHCDEPQPNTYYFVSVSNIINVGLYDYIFTDSNGQYLLIDGYYYIDNLVSGSGVIHVVNGIVVAITNCI